MEVGEGKYTFAIKGDGAYSVFKFEGGTHRVQRVPETESQGRIHTSTATVAVLPEAEEVDVADRPERPADRRLPLLRARAASRSTRPTRRCASRTSPSGIVVSMQDEKSQLQNREKALRVLRARLYERALAEQQAELAADRRSQVGTGDRAEKIRTYNYGERRVTDHRIKLTVHNLDQVLEGELDELTAALQADEKRRRLAGAGGRCVRHVAAAPAGHGRARRARRARSPRSPAARLRDARAWTPNCCWRTCSASTRERLLLDRELTRRRRRRCARFQDARAPPRGASASRSPTSSARAASAGSSSRSTAAC